MKYLTILVLILALLTPKDANALKVISAEAGINLETDKVATISEYLSSTSFAAFQMQVMASMMADGDRLIVIESSGGSSDYGDLIVQMMDIERELGTRVVCLVLTHAYSMAANILTHCDVRLALPAAKFMFHPIAISPNLGVRLTPAKLKEFLSTVEETENRMREANAKALGMSEEDYDKMAYAEKMLTAKELRSMKYLHGFAKIEK